MTDAERRRIEGLDSTQNYAANNAADFPAGSVQETQIEIIRTELALVEGFAANQAAGRGDAGSAFENKDTARENLHERMTPIADIAKVMEYEFDGIAPRFKMPRNRTDQDMLATARAWIVELVPFDADFQRYGLDRNFIADLTAAADAFENSMAAPETAVAERVAATAEIGAAIRRAMVAHRIVVAVMKVKYANNPGKLAAWLSASHIEKAPRRTPTPLPPMP